MTLKNKKILITGGTGSFGQACVAALHGHEPKRIVVLSRDEAKQFEMQKKWPDVHTPDSVMRYFIGDVRDKRKLHAAFHGIDVVIHAAAMKQIPTCEYNPFEAVKTNVLGAQNVIEAAIEVGVKKIITLSSDKACDPINLYGATKLTAEKLFIAANTRGPKFSVVRYGNVLGSRGSVLPVFLEQKKEGYFKITDMKMTRFWITIEQAVRFVLRMVKEMKGGEIFIPKMGSCGIIHLVEAIGGEAYWEKYELLETGIRPGEKMHEVLVSPHEADRAYDMGSYYMILPSLRFFDGERFRTSGTTIGESYSSETNDWQFDVGDIRRMVFNELV